MLSARSQRPPPKHDIKIKKNHRPNIKHRTHQRTEHPTTKSEDPSTPNAIQYNQGSTFPSNIAKTFE